jgi:hypothetical protein
MRRLTLMTLGVLSAAAAVAQPVSKAQAQRSAAVYNGPQVQASGWIWTDKYTYTPGEAVTLRGTLKPNNDLYPYTSFLYVQNNQTGEKRYFPGLTTEATDITGRTAEQGFTPLVLVGYTKAVILGPGGLLGGAFTAPNEPGMHTFVAELRDYTGTRVLKSMYAKFGVITGTETLQGDITSSRTLTNDKQWNLSGLVFVKNGAVLTIEPGTFIVGQPGSQPPSALIVTRTATIEAHGTRSRPIVFTASTAVGQRTRGDWGGLVLLGRAPVNTAANSANSNPAGEFYIEGLQTAPDALYGGTDPAHYCGTLSYVRVEFAGSILSPNNELNSFTWGGCGTRTVAHHLQAFYGLDDSFEWFGGTMNAHHLIGGLGADDYLDFQLGYAGKVQYGLFYQSPSQKGNRCIEGDNSEFVQNAEPWSNPVMYNVTCIGSGAVGFDEGNSPGIYLRRGARGTFNNFVVTNFFSDAVWIDAGVTQAQANNGLIRMNGLLLWKNNLGGSNAADTLAGNHSAAGVGAFTVNFLQGNPPGAAGNIVVANPLLTRPFEYSDPDFTGLFGSPIFRVGWVQPPDDGFFDQSARFVGGIGGEDWTEEWTRFPIETDIAP